MKNEPVCCDMCGRDTTNKCRICRTCLGGRPKKDVDRQIRNPILYNGTEQTEKFIKEANK